jgi:WD40 repeat protein
MRDSRIIATKVMAMRSLQAGCVTFALLLPAREIASQAATPVNLYVADIKYDNGGVHISNPRKLTGDRGVNSQPAFSLDGKSILFVSRRDTTGQSDVYRIDLASGVETQVTKTPENENTPTPTRDGGIMVIRWTPPTLFKEWGPWIYDKHGVPSHGVLPGPDTVGYYVPINATTYAMMRPKSRPAVAIFDATKSTMTDYDWPVANLPPQLVPSSHAVSYTRTDSLGHNEIRQLDLRTLSTSTVAPAVVGRTVHVWTPNGFILMGKGNAIYATKPGANGAWKQVAAFSQPDLQSLSTYVVSPRGDKVILISPLKPALHQVLRDSVQAGRSLSHTIEAYRAASNERRRYDLSMGALLGLADEEANRGHTDDAIPLFRYTGDLFPQAYEPAFELGAILMKTGDKKGALESYERSIRTNPRKSAEDVKAYDAAEKIIADLSHT